MVRNYLIVALRNLARQKTFSLINILGLAIGMATCIVIVRYVQDEFSFNGWHAKGDRIYRVIRETKSGDDSDYLPFTSGALAGTLAQDFPQVEKAARVWPWAVDARVDGKKFACKCVLSTLRCLRYSTSHSPRAVTKRPSPIRPLLQ